MGWRQRRALWQRRWLTRRIPPARHITLGPRSLFILPTRLGLGYLLVMIAIYLLGTNYQNNLVMLVAYCLASLFMVAMWLTHRNLLGLSLFGGPMALGEAGQSLPIRVTVHARRPARALLLTLNEGTLWLAQADSAPASLLLAIKGGRRGRVALSRLRVESRYPLGLFRCWSLLDLQLEAWLAPAPLHGNLLAGSSQGEREGRGQAMPATLGDFDALRPHRPGEPPSRIAWKQLAQGRGLLIKQFEEPLLDDSHLSLSRVGGQDLEARLAVLAWWCADYARRGLPFTLTLAGQTLGPESGPAFLQRCRLALARLGDRGETTAERGRDAAR
ncbi:DUF58 domain-containing protein [Aeromonas sp. FDAARGOS 1415]|uniref:DUF58 domain-containing protein n=1 Tax=Aeromonas TaxID=642 RepID=UPI001C22BDD5|nr:DUF58 domain-containing protein [Aeromonas sp. FDAARGOS 1415]QXB53371.1 DUF58 domain-containing protein [Aeromonas sp. FDAARGOS 1415]